jgi:hypothetical protein
VLYVLIIASILKNMRKLIKTIEIFFQKDILTYTSKISMKMTKKKKKKRKLIPKPLKKLRNSKNLQDQVVSYLK